MELAIGFAVYSAFVLLALRFNHNASVASGNHNDPNRDAGQDGKERLAAHALSSQPH